MNNKINNKINNNIITLKPINNNNNNNNNNSINNNEWIIALILISIAIIILIILILKQWCTYINWKQEKQKHNNNVDSLIKTIIIEDNSENSEDK